MAVARDELLDLLRTRFGHDAFRPGQELVVRSLLAGRDVLALLPTGAGKSLVYSSRPRSCRALRWSSSRFLP